jgi:hypothetical protein
LKKNQFFFCNNRAGGILKLKPFLYSSSSTNNNTNSKMEEQEVVANDDDATLAATLQQQDEEDRQRQEQEDESLALALQMSMERPPQQEQQEQQQQSIHNSSNQQPPKPTQAVSPPHNPTKTATTSMLDRISNFFTGGGSSSSTSDTKQQNRQQQQQRRRSNANSTEFDFDTNYILSILRGDDDESSDEEPNEEIETTQQPRLTDRQRRQRRVDRYVARKQRELADEFNVFPITVPELPIVINTNTNEQPNNNNSNSDSFIVRTPDSGSIVLSRAATLGPGTVIWIPYDGEPIIPTSTTNTELTLEEIARDRENAFLDYYRFNPSEIETNVTIVMGDRPLGGCKLIEQIEGVFVSSAVISCTDPTTIHQLRGGDLLVSCNGQPIESLGKLLSIVTSNRLGSTVTIRALRARPPFVRCPLGHWMRRIDEVRSLDPVRECNKCKRTWGKFSCEECQYEMCGPCYHQVWCASKPRRPIPVNNTQPFIEAPVGTMLSFSDKDVGTKVLLFWYSTGEWWLGQITAWDQGRGHTVRYETLDGGMAQETIYDFEVREYRVLLEAELRHSNSSNYNNSSTLPTSPTKLNDEVNILFGDEYGGSKQGVVVVAATTTTSSNSTSTAPFVGDLLGLDVEQQQVQQPLEESFAIVKEETNVIGDDGKDIVQDNKNDDQQINVNETTTTNIDDGNNEDVSKVTLNEEEFELLNKYRGGDS